MSKTNTTKASDIAFLHEAAHKGQIGVIQENIEQIEDINVRDERGYTLLHTAAQAGQIKVMELLIERGANIGLKNKVGDTPLHLTNESFFLMGALLLVSKGAAINETNGKGEYALGPMMVRVANDGLVRETINNLKRDIPASTSEDIKNDILREGLSTVISELSNRKDSNDGSIQSLIKNCEEECAKLLAAVVKVPEKYKGIGSAAGRIGSKFRKSSDKYKYERF